MSSAKAKTGIFFSSASWRIRLAMSALWTGEPPGELTASATAFRPRWANARDQAFEPLEVEPGAAERPETADHAAQPEHADDGRTIAETPERHAPQRAPHGAGGFIPDQFFPGLIFH